MPSGGLLRDPSLLFSGDSHFLKTTFVQFYIFGVILCLSAYYHFILQGRGKSSKRPRGSKDEEIAQVETIIVYPIKSCHGVTLEKVEVSRKGFKYDRRWLIVAKDGIKMLSLREEPKLTFIIPSFEQDEEGNETMQLRLSERSQRTISPIHVPLNATEVTRSSWQLLPPINFYGSLAQGRVVQLDANTRQEWKGSPSEWISEVSVSPEDDVCSSIPI
jgi:hypothetical protein